jgi:hypothetical protein
LPWAACGTVGPSTGSVSWSGRCWYGVEFPAVGEAPDRRSAAAGAGSTSRASCFGPRATGLCHRAAASSGSGGCRPTPDRKVEVFWASIELGADRGLCSCSGRCTTRRLGEDQRRAMAPRRSGHLHDGELYLLAAL